MGLKLKMQFSEFLIFYYDLNVLPLLYSLSKKHANEIRFEILFCDKYERRIAKAVISKCMIKNKF